MDTSKIKEISQGIVEVKNAGNTVWGGVYVDTINSPGPKKLIGGNVEAGFFGECPTSELITGDALARLIGLSAGTNQYSNEPWLKFAYMGKIEFIAKKPFRYAISWDNIHAVNAVFGRRTVRINSKTYMIRLIKGKTEGKQGDQSAYAGDINKRSEWNRLMLPIHKNAPSYWRYPGNVESPTEDWGVNYSDNDLITNNSYGGMTWCQEYGPGSKYRLDRGYGGVSYSDCGPPSNDSYYRSWRPVLELVR